MQTFGKKYYFGLKNKNMKYYITAGVIVILILIGYFVFSGYGATTNSAPQPVLVSMIKETVYLYASSTKNEVTEPTQAFEGDSIETLSSGRALLQMKNGTVTTIDYSTKLTLKTHSDDLHSTLLLGQGKVWATVKKVFGKGEFYEIETQNAVAVVRGTSFGLSFDGESTTIEVTEGVVAFTPIDPETGARLYDKTVLIEAGQKATIKGGAVVEILNLTSQDKKEDWFIFNNTSLTENESGANEVDVKISDLEIKTR